METRSEKFEEIVNAAKKLFWKHGIRRISIEEICEEAGVSKMTFYKYFSNKTSLAIYIIEAIFDSGLKTYKEILNSKISYEEKVRKMIDLKMSNAHEMSQELVDDIYKNKDEELFNTIESLKIKMFGIYLEDFRVSQRNGEIRADIQPEFILYFLNEVTRMVTDEKLVSIYSNTEEMIADVMSFFFYGVLPHAENQIK